MKKVISATKLSSPSKLVRSSSGEPFSNGLISQHSQTDPVDDKTSELKKQITDFQESVKHLQNVCDAKEKAIGALARDKERLTAELNRQRRANLNLSQQLNDERSFYMKEKQRYCKEMNESKKNRRKNSTVCKDASNNSVSVIESLKNENTKFKQMLEYYIETNYNLCIRFLRMKNTKDYLKKRFERYQSEQSKILTDLTTKLDESREEINLIVNEQFQYPLSASNKNYLEVAKRNSQLIHENLCLKLEIQQMITNIEKIEGERIKQESRTQLQYIKKSQSKPNLKQRSITLGSGDSNNVTKATELSSDPARLEVNSDNVRIRGSKHSTGDSKSRSSAQSSSTQLGSSRKLDTISETTPDNEPLSPHVSPSSDSIRTQSAPEMLETVNFFQIDSEQIKVKDTFTNT